jgi:hypothetical protein
MTGGDKDVLRTRGQRPAGQTRKRGGTKNRLSTTEHISPFLNRPASLRIERLGAPARRAAMIASIQQTGISSRQVSEAHIPRRDERLEAHCDRIRATDHATENNPPQYEKQQNTGKSLRTARG